MPHVAFDPSTVLKPHLAARSTPNRDAPAFESLLDTNQPAADNRAADLAADRASARADRPDRTDHAPARDRAKAKDDSTASNRADDAKSDKTKDGAKAADDQPKASDTTADAKAPAEKADADPKSDVKDAKSEAEAKAKAAELAGGTTASPEAKPAEAATAATVAAVAALIPTLTPADAIATAVPAAVEAGMEQPAVEAAAEATVATAGKGKTDKLATAKAANGGDETKQPAKAEAEPQADKAAATPEKAEKADAHARGEALAKDTRAANVDVADKPAFDPALAAPKAGADATQAAAMIARTHQTAPAAATAAAASAPLAQQAAAVPLSGVAFEISSKALSGTNHFEIRLDPPDLGRIEVRLNVDRDGTITTSVIADRPDTLDLLRRDSSGLERAMQDAGLKTSDNGTQFSLRDQSMNQQQGGRPSETAQLVVDDETLSAATARDYGRLAGQRGGVDIRV